MRAFSRSTTRLSLRATATFLRTTVTRNTPFDRFLAGDDRALTEPQLRGARLFFTPATGGGRGAGCFSCHSGPMLNKQQRPGRHRDRPVRRKELHPPPDRRPPSPALYPPLEQSSDPP